MGSGHRVLEDMVAQVSELGTALNKAHFAEVGERALQGPGVEVIERFLVIERGVLFENELVDGHAGILVEEAILSILGLHFERCWVLVNLLSKLFGTLLLLSRRNMMATELLSLSFLQPRCLGEHIGPQIVAHCDVGGHGS